VVTLTAEILHDEGERMAQELRFRVTISALPILMALDARSATIVHRTGAKMVTVNALLITSPS